MVIWCSVISADSETNKKETTVSVSQVYIIYQGYGLYIHRQVMKSMVAKAIDYCLLVITHKFLKTN